MQVFIQFNLGRLATAVLIFLCLILVGSASARGGNAHPIDRQHACILHRYARGRATCTNRARLARRGATTRRAGRSAPRTRQPVPPSSGTTSSSGTGSTSGTGTTTSTGSTGSSGTVPTSTFPTGSGSPIGEPTLTPPAPAPAAALQTGVDSGTNMSLDLQGSEALGAKLVRVEFPIATTTTSQMESVIGGYAAHGIRVLPLATFRGTLPTPAQAQSLAAWARIYGPGGTFWATHAGGQDAVQAIEFGNETSYGYQYGDAAGDASYRERAESYARRLEEAAEAISATGVHVGLLAQADDWTGDWVNGMFAAVPTLSRYVAGWTIHPYHHWRSRLEGLLEQTAAHGDTTIPIDITEWGLPADNGRCLEADEEYNRCMPYSEAASILRTTFGEMRQLLEARLGMFILYQVRDQGLTAAGTESEQYYGALQHELQPKGEYTTATQEVLAGSIG
jgi:hypothetical protein